jgi:hypothetical protein
MGQDNIDIYRLPHGNGDAGVHGPGRARPVPRRDQVQAKRD